MSRYGRQQTPSCLHIRSVPAHSSFVSQLVVRETAFCKPCALCEIPKLNGYYGTLTYKSGLVMRDSCTLLTASRFYGCIKGIYFTVLCCTSNKIQVCGSTHPRCDAVFLDRWLQTFGAASHGRRQASISVMAVT
jgi:hypothetical protein